MKSRIKIKQVIIVWVSIYPAITLALLFFGEQLNSMPLMLRTLVLTLILVPLMVYVLIPLWSRIFDFMIQLGWRWFKLILVLWRTSMKRN